MMKDALKWLIFSILTLVIAAAVADPIKDNVLDNYKAGWYPNVQQGKIMTCPETCKVHVNGVAEHEISAGVKSKETFVCKTAKKTIQPLPRAAFLYGNQFDKRAVCYTTDLSGKTYKSEHFYCLCLAGEQCTLPDLIVAKINKPQWDNTNHQSIITAEIKNVGVSMAGASLAQLIDPSTMVSPGVPYNDVANTPALAPGASVTVTFHLPYWVYNPDADLEVTADYKNDVKECHEDNNKLTFHELG